MKTPGMDKFSKRLDEIFEQGMPTKAQILDAYNKFAAQSSATDKAIIEKMGELIEDLKAYDSLWETDEFKPWLDKRRKHEAELQALKDKRDAT